MNRFIASIPRKNERGRVRLCLAVLAAALLGATAIHGQAGDPTAADPTAANPSTMAPAVFPVRKMHVHARPQAVPAQIAPAEAPPAPAVETAAAPQVPHWPVNDQPAPAAVIWDSHGLSIEATNSSLQQIMRDFSTATGAKVEGLGSDERVFGFYGPGQARDVLSELLQGSGYNVIMIGDQGHGAPRQILLSVRQKGDAPPDANRGGGNNGDDESLETDVEEPQPQVPMPARPGFGPGGMPRTPQQMMQERQQMQQQLQQMQRQNNPQQN
jgi:hypothetical protein